MDQQSTVHWSFKDDIRTNRSSPQNSLSLCSPLEGAAGVRWVLDNKLDCPNNRWMIQIPRLYSAGLAQTVDRRVQCRSTDRPTSTLRFWIQLVRWFPILPRTRRVGVRTPGKSIRTITGTTSTSRAESASRSKPSCRTSSIRCSLYRWVAFFS